MQAGGERSTLVEVVGRVNMVSLNKSTAIVKEIPTIK